MTYKKKAGSKGIQGRGTVWSGSENMVHGLGNPRPRLLLSNERKHRRSTDWAAVIGRAEKEQDPQYHGVSDEQYAPLSEKNYLQINHRIRQQQGLRPIALLQDCSG
jgi:hypothetical protein